MQAQIDRKAVRRRIRFRVRRRLSGTASRPRLAVFRSDRHIYVQAIDDEAGRTIAQASTVDGELGAQRSQAGNLASAKSVGELIARRLREAGVRQVVFDRGGFLYHGRVRALAEAARQAGIEF